MFAVALGLLMAGMAWRKAFLALALGVGLAGAAFCLAGWQVARVNTLDFAAASKVHWMVGTVREIHDKEEKPNRVTLRLEDVETYGLGEGVVTRAGIGAYKSQAKDLAVGSGVALPVVLLAPEGPRFDGERDGRLWRFFNGGGVGGYVLGTVEPTYRDKKPETRYQMAADWLERVRGRLFKNSKGYADGAMAALLMGEEKAIPKEIRDAYQKTGLSHLLAISGMQLTIVALGIFWLLRWLGALIPWVVLRIDVRFWAAVLALLGTVFYTLLAGASVSLVRASIMAGIVMIAVLSGRMRSALRAWCAAVVLVIVFNPVMVTRAGFQLSIAAVLGLILLAMAEEGVKGQGIKGLRGLRGLVLATVVAGCMTAPLLVANFGQFSVLGMLANLIAVPVMGIATYVGMVALVLWPLGLEKPLLELMGMIVRWVNALAVWLSGLPLVSVNIDRSLWWAIGGFAAVAVVSILIRRWWEAGAAVASMTGIALVLALMAPKPEIMVWEDGKVGLLKTGEGYKLAWTKDVEDARKMAAKAGIPLDVPQSVGETVDDTLMPVSRYEHFAWAERTNGVWRVEPYRCGRIWQRMAESCWQD